ncbi:MAG TPA: O-antigen ligase family protein [Candidatus Baltobacteraceae bacterium]
MLKRCIVATARASAFIVAMLGACVVLLGAYYPPGLSDGTSNPSGALVAGIYPGGDEGQCCWLADRSAFKIAPPAEAAVAVLTIFIPDYAYRGTLQSLAVRVGDAPVATACCYGPGIHQFPVPIPPHAPGSVLIVRTTQKVSFVPRAIQKEIGPSTDTRRLSVLLRGVEFRAGDGETIQATPRLALWDKIGKFLCVALAIAVFFLTRKRPIWGLAALILIEPLGHDYPVWHTTVAPFKTALIAVLAGLAFHPAWRTLARDRRALILLASIASVAAATVLSIAHATYHEPVIRETLKALEYALTFAVAYVALRAEPEESFVRGAFAWTTGIVCVMALAQEMIGAPEGTFVAGHALPRIAGPLEGPNQLAAWIGIVAPVSLAFFAQLRAIGGLSLLTGLLTLSRGGTIGLIAAAAAVFARSVRAGWIVAVGAVGAVAILALRFGFHATPGEVDRYNGGLGTRADLWRAAFEMFRAHPLTGVGAGNYELLLGQYDLLGIRTHANSWYFQSMAEGGVVMLLAIAFVVVATILSFARARTGFGLAAFAASIGLCLHQTVDDLVFYPKVGAMWWLLLGVAAASLAAAATTRGEPVAEDAS